MPELSPTSVALILGLRVQLPQLPNPETRGPVETFLFTPFSGLLITSRKKTLGTGEKVDLFRFCCGDDRLPLLSCAVSGLTDQFDCLRVSFVTGGSESVWRRSLRRGHLRQETDTRRLFSFVSDAAKVIDKLLPRPNSSCRKDDRTVVIFLSCVGSGHEHPVGSLLIPRCRNVPVSFPILQR